MSYVACAEDTSHAEPARAPSRSNSQGAVTVDVTAWTAPRSGDPVADSNNLGDPAPSAAALARESSKPRSPQVTDFDRRACELLGVPLERMLERHDHPAWALLQVYLYCAVSAVCGFIMCLWGSAYKWLPFNWVVTLQLPLLLLHVHHALRLPLDKVMHTRAATIPLLLWGICAVPPQLVLVFAPASWYPNLRTGSQIWFAVVLQAQMFSTLMLMYILTPSQHYARRHVPVWTYTADIILHTLRQVDPSLDLAMVTSGLRGAIAGICPVDVNGTTESCKLHFVVLSFMLGFVVLDQLFLWFEPAVTTWNLPPDEERKWLVRMLAGEALSELGVVATSGVFVALGMASSSNAGGINKLFVVTCAAFTAMQLVWTAFMMLPQHVQAKIQGRATHAVTSVTRKARNMSSRASRVHPSQPGGTVLTGSRSEPK